MRFLFSIIALFALLFTLVTATSSTEDDTHHDARFTMSLFRPWTWSLPLPALAQSDATSQHVRRHGPRRRAMHP
ncbi:hypothetical protein B0H19DRAFT_1167054 [Mycena capillaripes]|nr:hypothetical protein B0H19DRAFT_1167054 [Mycena capillaripes]